jgi:metal-responsive CopG/Arc/MetJ family transcriptional regulator
MKTAISLPDELCTSADEVAESMGISRSGLIQRALELYLDQRSRDLVVAELNQVYGKVNSSVPRALAQYQKSTMGAEDW